MQVLVIGAGPCGLRAAIECALLGAKVVVVEKRDRFTRNNVLHIWPFVIADLKNLGAKLFYPKFCAGSIDHISIRQLQCILLKVSLVLGVEVHEGLGFSQLVKPGPDPRDGRHMGWRALLEPSWHYLEEYEFNVLIGADGKRNTVPGFQRRELRGKLAIGITANFKNRRTHLEERVPEISGVAFIFNQQFFKDMKEATGIDLENIVYYKDETHYFVMCAKKASLMEKGVIMKDYEDASALLDASNVDNAALLEYARQAADFATQKKLPKLEFAVNGFGLPDVAMFDFTSLFSAENSCRILEERGERLLLSIVGDSLHEPFWPTGSGAARGFLSVLDTAWFLRSYALGKMTALEVIAEREFFYRRLAQTTPRSLAPNYGKYTIGPRTRYPVSAEVSIQPHQVLNLFNTDDPAGMKEHHALCSSSPAKRRSGDLLDTPQRTPYQKRQEIILYVQSLLNPYNLRVFNLDLAWEDGVLLCALVHRFKPQSIDLLRINDAPVSDNLRQGFRLLQSEFNLSLPDDLCKALGLESGTVVGEDTPLPEEWDVDREGMQEFLSDLRDKLRALVAERLRLMQASRAPPSASSPPASPRKVARTTPKVPPPSRALLESNRKAQTELGSGDASDGELSESDLAGLDEAGEEEVEAWLAEWEDEETAARHRRRIADIQASLEDEEPAKKPWNVGPDCKAGLVEKLAPERLHQVEKLLLGEILPASLAQVEARKKKKAAVKTRKLNENEIKDMEKKLEETAMGNLLYRKKDYIKPYSRQDSLMVAATTSDLKEKAKNGFKEAGSGGSRFAALDDKMRELDTKLRLPNKSGAIPVAALKDTVARPKSILSPTPSTESLAGKGPPPPVPPKKSPLHDPRSPITTPKAPPPAVRPVTMPGLGQKRESRCFVCNGEVYLAERVTAEGQMLHKSCFKCAYCQTPLRLGGYGFQRSPLLGDHFWCHPHLRLTDAEKHAKLRRGSLASPARSRPRSGISSPALTPTQSKGKASVPIASLPSLISSPAPAKTIVTRTTSEDFAPYTTSIFARAMQDCGADVGSTRRSSGAGQTPERAEFELSFPVSSKHSSPSRSKSTSVFKVLEGGLLSSRSRVDESGGAGELEEEEIQRRNHVAQESEEEDVNEPEREAAACTASTPSSSDPSDEDEELWDWQRAELKSTLDRVSASTAHPKASLSYAEAAEIARSWRDRHATDGTDATGDELDDEEDDEDIPADPPSSPLDPDAIRAATMRKLEAVKEEARERAKLKSDIELCTPASRNSTPAPSHHLLPAAQSRSMSVADEKMVTNSSSGQPNKTKVPPLETPKLHPDVKFRSRTDPRVVVDEGTPPAKTDLPSSESRKEAQIKTKHGRQAYLRKRRGCTSPSTPPPPSSTTAASTPAPPRACVDDELALTEEEEEEPAPTPRTKTVKSRESLGGEVTEAEIRRVQRAAERLLVEKEAARACETQELQRNLVELEVRRAEIAEAGRKTEARLRGLLGPMAGLVSAGRKEAALSHWLVLAKEQGRLMYKAAELAIKRRELELEGEHGRLQLELREASEAGLAAESRLLESLLANVKEREGLAASKQEAEKEKNELTARLAAVSLDTLPDDVFPPP